MTSKLPKEVREAMAGKLPKEVRDAMNSPRLIDYTESEFAIAVTDLEEMLTHVFYAGALFGVKVAELMIEKKLPKSRAEIRRMEKEAKNAKD